MAWLYGNAISEEERSDLLHRLRRRGTTESLLAASAIAYTPRDATRESASEARMAILYELEQWPRLDASSPRLAAVRDRLSNRAKPKRIT